MSQSGKNRKAGSGKPRSLLQQLARVPEKLFDGGFRQQYAALCFRRIECEIQILLVTTRDSGRWVIPKGWPIKHKKPHQTAATEAWEEAGVRGAVKKKPIGRYTYLKLLDDGDVVPCVVDVFQIEVNEVQDRFKEKGERRIAWVSPDEASRRVRDIELKSLLVEFKPKKVKRPATSMS
ncbi:NUDIX hydrolase [Rhizobium helianthi]|uniref:NUDIX hydrolase n=1 Tax=Rhizobium helianthi TaxID=1132695 RepID=A0ABW4M2M6_9HYPH